MKCVVIDPELFVPWVSRRVDIKTTTSAYGFGVVDLSRKAILGGVVFDNFTGHSIAIHVASESRYWLIREMLYTTFNYAFNICKVDKLVGCVKSTNVEAIEFDKNIGFTYETTIKDLFAAGEDAVILELRKKDCKYITPEFRAKVRHDRILKVSYGRQERS